MYWRKASAPGPATSNLENEVSSKRATRSRVAWCSAPMAGDQKRAAQPCGIGQWLIRGEPVGTLPAGFFAEDRAQFAQAIVDRAEAQLARAAALFEGITDIVIRAVDLMHARGKIRAAGRIGPEAADIHMPQIEFRLALNDPFRQHLAHPPRARNAMCAEAARRPESPHLRRLPQNKLAIRGKRLQPIHPFHQLDICQRRHAFDAAGEQRSEALLIVVPHCRIGGVGKSIHVESAGIALIAAEYETLPLLAAIDQLIWITQVRHPLLCQFAQGSSDDVLML